MMLLVRTALLLSVVTVDRLCLKICVAFLKMPIVILVSPIIVFRGYNEFDRMATLLRSLSVEFIVRRTPLLGLDGLSLVRPLVMARFAMAT